MKPFGLKHQNRVIIDLKAYKADDATNTDGAEDVSNAPNKIEIITVGVWDTPWHGAFAITRDDLQEMIDNNNAGLRSGLPIDYEHDEDGGAAGWITNLRIEPSSADPMLDALWGDVEWTPQAAQQIKDGVYRYFSPEFYPEDYCDPMDVDDVYDNVLIGGGLTNRPLMRNLAPVAASDSKKGNKKVLTTNSPQHTIYVESNKPENMDLQTLLAKTPADLSDEEKAFVVEHKDELTDEQKSTFESVLTPSEEEAGEEAGGEENEAGEGEEAEAGGEEEAGEGTQASDKGSVKMSAKDVAMLKKQAAEGSKAMAILAKKEASEHTKAMVINKEGGGHFAVEAHENLTNFYLSLDEKQQKQFNELVAKLPNAKHLFETRGADNGVSGGAVEQVQAAIAEAMKANDKLTLRQAQGIVAKDNPTLMKQYYQEIEGR